MHRVLPLALLTVLLPACGAVHTLTRPEGDGGWSAARRQEELAQRARAAGVDLGTPVAEAPATQPAPSSGPLDLPTALTLARSGNRRIAEARSQLESAQQHVYDARGRLLPSTTGTGRYAWYTDPQTNQISLPPQALAQFGGTAPVVKVRDADFGTINGTLALPLDITGEIRHALAAAQAGYRGEQARVWATTLDQQVTVVRAYFALLEAQRLREVTRQTIALYREQAQTAQSRFDNGRVTKNDLLVVQVVLSNAAQELLQRDLAVDRARWNLNQAIGADIDGRTEVVDVRQPPNVPPAVDALRLAYANNPVLASLLEEQQRLEETVRSLERSRLPRFSAGAAIDYSTSHLLEPQRIGSGFTGFTWDLGTDTRREAQIADARLAADRNHTVIEGQLREIEAAVRTVQRATEERLAALAAANAAVGQAEENLRIRQQQFEAGRAQSTDVLDAERLLSQQRATLATALYQAFTRRAELQQLIGLPLDDLVSSAQR
jgi:outer membrane protein TolC